jgi:hypothetical protein
MQSSESFKVDSVFSTINARCLDSSFVVRDFKCLDNILEFTDTKKPFKHLVNKCTISDPDEIKIPAENNSFKEYCALRRGSPDVEVLNVDIFVWSGFSLAPEEQTFLGSHLFYGDVLNGETEDDGPDHAQGHLDVAVDDFWKKN